MNLPKISVIMSVYNGEKYLKEAVESILNQIFKDFEFIIIDDGSTDRTLEILKEYAKKDERIKIITNSQNVGLTKSLNKAIKQARGEYIARMDADDISLPERFGKQVEFMESNPEIGLLGTVYYEIDRNGKILGKKIFLTTNKELQKNLIKYNPFFHSSIMMRRSVFEKVGLYNECFPRVEDYELWFRTAKHFKFANLPEFLIKRRYTKENISVKNENEQLKWAIEIRKDVIWKRQYPLWNFIYLIRPFIVLKIPPTVRQFLRKHLLKSKLYD